MRRTVLATTVTTERPYVSKSKFLWGRQCKKLLWYAYNAKDQIPEADAAQQAIFDQDTASNPLGTVWCFGRLSIGNYSASVGRGSRRAI
jgi:hypothetical protein